MLMVIVATMPSGRVISRSTEILLHRSRFWMSIKLYLQPIPNQGILRIETIEVKVGTQKIELEIEDRIFKGIFSKIAQLS